MSMSDKVTNYDLVLFGSDLQGPELEIAVKKLAQMLKITPDKAMVLLETKGSPAAQDITQEIAEKARDKLLAWGIRANIRPTLISPIHKWTVAEVEKPKDLYKCPACGHEHHLVEGKPKPAMCENYSCRIVFAGYERVQKEKDTKQKIEERLKKELADKLARDVNERKRQEELDLEKRLEEELRKKYGLPRLINSKYRLIGSAVTLHLLGIVVGLGSIFIYDDFTNPGTSKQETMMALRANGVNPGIIDQEAVSKMLAIPASSEVEGNPSASSIGIESGTQPGSQIAGTPSSTEAGESLAGTKLLGVDADTLPSSGNTQAKLTSSTPEPASASSVNFLNATLSSSKTDTEWDQYLLTRAEAALAKGDTADAIKLIDHVGNVNLRFDRGARLMWQLWIHNKTADAMALYQNLITAGERLTGGPVTRIEALCTVARYLNAAKRKAEVEAILQKVIAIADTIIEPADKAVASSQTAVLFTMLGRAEDAQQWFTVAINSLGDIPNPIYQLTTIARIAPSYVQAGYRPSALQLLDDAIRKSGSLTDTTERSQALGQLAEASARLNEMQMALGVVQQISAATIRDQTLYHLITHEITSGRLAQATDVAKYLTTPTYQALAFGFLGLSQQGQTIYKGLAATSAQQARAAVDAIGPIGEKAAVMSTLGRFAVRSGDSVQAEQYFTNSKQLAESLSDVTERNCTMAVLAVNHAQALRFTEANQDLAEVTDAMVRDPVATDINNWQQAGNIGL